MVNVLADFHHSGLWHSLALMAERFGWTLYRPKGPEWFDEWYWIFGRSTYNDDRLARQFLYDPEPIDGEFPDWPIRMVTLPEAKAMDWAYVIATAQDNQGGFAMFAREVGAAYVVQVGNTGQTVDWSRDPLALVSSEVDILGRGIKYHQEMDPVVYAEPPADFRTAASFVNCMPSMGTCWSLLTAAQESMPVHVFGIDSDVIKPYSRLVNLAGQYGFGWHDKAQGDGFGHVIHTWAAVGRPLIGHGSHYAGRMAQPFWEDMVTCIDLDKHSIPEVLAIIEAMTPDKHREMCEAIRSRFDAIDYDGEADAIRAFLGMAAAVAA